MSTGRYYRNGYDPEALYLSRPEFAVKLWHAVDGVLARIDSMVAKAKGLHGSGVYVGVGGIALMYFHLAKQAALGVKPCGVGIQEGAKSEGVRHWGEAHLLEKALRMVGIAETFPGHLDQRVTFLEGRSGIHAIKASVLSHMGRLNEAKESILALENISNLVLNMGRDECEILYGRCGYLTSLLFAQVHVGKDRVRKDVIGSVAKQVFEEGKRCARDRNIPDAGLLYSYHGTFYAGFGHGLAGILYTLNCCRAEILEVDPSSDFSNLASLFAAALLNTALPSGNFPVALGRTDDKVVHWCHGAPGFVPLLCQIASSSREIGGDSQMALLAPASLELAAKSCNFIWERGLLKKGLGLCHGIAGNGYAFLSMYRCQRGELYLKRALAFADIMADNWTTLENVPDRPVSLYEGMAGAVCFWIDVMNPDASGFPGVEF